MNLERKGSGLDKAKAVAMGTMMMLGLTACIDNKSAEDLPEGAKLPQDYEYVVMIGEADDNDVAVYSDTLPEILNGNGFVRVVIDGSAFCPGGRDKYGQERSQAESIKRGNFCFGDGVYSHYDATVNEGRAVVLRTEETFWTPVE